ncbi:MAG: DUF2330 domain-containing protein [Alphaproteobacteria bacterium]
MLRHVIAAVAFTGVMLFSGVEAKAFCGFYVAKADTKMFNRASKVVIARAQNRTVISMANDYKGDPGEFAIVIPTPTVLQESQINVAEPSLIDHLDAYTAPRLVEYFDGNPCEVAMLMESMRNAPVTMAARGAARAKALGVKVEAEYTVGEYDIQILSASQSDGLLTYLTESGYNLPKGAAPTLSGYLKQGMKFFVAKVNLEKHAARNAKYLRPIQIAFESDMFMLPIRLGMLNADGEQELFVFTLTQQGRVETANYQTTPMPTGMDIPIHVKDEFDDFYRAMFKQQAKDKPGVAFLEYAWDMGWCDPCAADPLSRAQLSQLGAWWVNQGSNVRQQPKPRPGIRPRRPQPVNVYVTRLHLRYTAATHPDDLMFKETNNRQNFQGRYVMRHPWMGGDMCEAAVSYRQTLGSRWEKESQTLANLTGWNINDIRTKQPTLAAAEPLKPWWEQMWKK